jgi:hypothetical protein
MTDTASLDRLIIENLADLDSAAQRIDEIEERIWKAIGAEIEAWGAKNRWEVAADPEDAFEASPPAWVDEEDQRAWFEFGWGPDDVDNGGKADPSFDLTRLCGLAGGRFCLWLVVKTPRRTWKPLAQAEAETIALHGFQLSDHGNFYIDCTPGAAALAAAVEDGDFTEALECVRTALAAAKAAEPIFTRMLKKAGEL